ncbi:MAG: M12 family metallo-peptidase, partial [Proteobacteria bacterium]|nr:M12 family metallo-peptidase [Pseudomonadota bacterium]
ILIPFQAMAWKHLDYIKKAPELSLAYKLIHNHEISFCNNSSLVDEQDITDTISSWLKAGLNTKDVDLTNYIIVDCVAPDILIDDSSLISEIVYGCAGGLYTNPYYKKTEIPILNKELEEINHKSDVTPLDKLRVKQRELYLEILNSVKYPSVFLNNTDEAIKKYKMSKVLLHEIGHAFGLCDEDNSAPASKDCDPANQSPTRDKSSIMSYQNQSEVLSQYDKEGISKIFERLNKNQIVR